MIRLLFVILTLAATAACCSAQAKTGKTHLWGRGLGAAVELRWLPAPENPFPTEGYTILRRRRGGIPTFYPIDTVFVRTEPEKSVEFPPAVRDSLASLVGRITSGKNSRAATEELRLAAMAHPAIFWTIFGFRYVDSSAKPNTRYDYILATGIDEIATANDVGRAETPLPVPPEVSAVAVGNSIRLSWETRGMLGKGIGSWKIIRKQDGMSAARLSNPVLSAFFSDEKPAHYVYEDFGLNKGSIYAYYVVSVDIFGRESAPSREATAEVRATVPLMPPAGFNARIFGETALLTWQKSHRKQEQITGYHLYRQTGNDVVRLTSAPVQDTVFTDSPGSIAAAEAAYFATAVDAAGNESAESFHSIVAVPDNQPPLRPAVVDVTTDGGTLLLRWSRSASSDAAGYEVARSGEEAGVFAIVSSPFADTVFDNTVGLGMTYWYKIRTVDFRGNHSDWTAAIAGKTPGGDAPPNPVITSAAGGDRRISLEWLPVAFPALAGYWVNRYVDTTFTPITVNTTIIPPALTNYSDTAVSVNILYVYEIVAQDSSANFSAPSPRAYSRSYDSRRPVAPAVDSLLIAEIGITVVWRWETTPVLPYDIVVERSRDGKRFVQISPLIPSEEARYPDNAVTTGETYYYRLRARNKSGVWSSPSAFRSVDFTR